MAEEEYREIHVWDYERGNKTRKDPSSLDKEIKEQSKEQKYPGVLLRKYEDIKGDIGGEGIKPFLFLRDGTFYFQGHLLVIDKKKLHSELKKRGIDIDIKPDNVDGLMGAYKIVAKENTDKKIPVKKVGKIITLTKEETKETENNPITNEFVHYLLNSVYRKNRGIAAAAEGPLSLWENNAPDVSREMAAGKGSEEAKLNKLQRREVVEYRKHLILKQKLIDYLKKTYS